MHADLDLRRIEFVTRRYIELRGLTSALLGAIVALSALFARAALGPDGSLYPLFEIPMMSLMILIAPIEIAYQLAFGRAKPPFWRDVVGAVPILLITSGIFADWAQLLGILSAPASVGALLFALYGAWIVLRDWRWRPYYVLLCGAAVIAIVTSAGAAPDGTYASRLMTYLCAYAVLGVGITAVGLLDHRLLITSLHDGAAPPPTTAQWMRAARTAFLTTTLLAVAVPIVLALCGPDDRLLGAGVGGAFTVSYLVIVVNSFRATRRYRVGFTRNAPDLAGYSPVRVPLTIAPLVLCFTVVDAAAFDVLAPVRLFPLATTLTVGAASGWWALRDWPARRHYLLGAAAAGVTVVALVAFPMPPIRAFTWLVMTTSAAVAVETFVDYRALRRRAADGGEGEVHVDAV
jgi:hypothetical protein